jgi:hypothetical protein
VRYNIWTVKDHTLPGYAGYSTSNTYRVDAPDLPNAVVLADRIVSFELAVLGTNVIMSHYRIRTDSEGIGEGYFSSGFGFGLRSVPLYSLGNTEWACLVNCYGGGRLRGRKWLRLGLTEADIAGPNLHPDLVSLVQSSYADPLAAMGVCRTRADLLIDAALVDPRLRLYSLRHGTHRRELLVI